MNKNHYDMSFFSRRQEYTQRAAESIVPIIISLFRPSSVIDYGCANGIWLSEFLKLGIKDIFGVDGYEFSKGELLIPEESFQVHNLEENLILKRKYDLAISLEVAEHLRPETSDLLIESLTNASNIVVFSAAIPYQGGVNHLNEQWPEYWAEKFDRRGYVPLDLIRARIWTNKDIPVWYKQNMICFVLKSDEKFLSNEYFKNCQSQKERLSIVHPDLYLMKIDQLNKVQKNAFKKDKVHLLKKIINGLRR